MSHPGNRDITPIGELMLNPATRVLWRAADTVQLELGDRAVVVEGADTEFIRRLSARMPSDHSSAADRHPPELERLVEAGFVWPRAGSPASDIRLRPPAARLSGELTALAARHSQSAAEILAGRRCAAVVVHGTGRVAAQIAVLLAAAGVGRVHAADAQPVRLTHCAPGGVCPADEGRPFAAAVADAIARDAPDAQSAPPPFGASPDLVVLVGDEPLDTERRAVLHADRVAHLAVVIGVGSGVVGPLVVPGRSSCLRCAELHRKERDDAWPALAVQLGVPRRHGPACEVSLATAVAGVAAKQALAHLDGDAPAVWEGTLEIHPPDWRLRRRSWPAHPSCDCLLATPT
jgi:hypothetical protein